MLYRSGLRYHKTFSRIGSLILSFYRATLGVSAVFAFVRRLSVTLVDCIQTAEDIVKNFFPDPVARHSSFFEPQCRYQIPRGIYEGANTRGVGKNAIFD